MGTPQDNDVILGNVKQQLHSIATDKQPHPIYSQYAKNLCNDDIFLLRFIRAKEYVEEDVHKMVGDMLDWRVLFQDIGVEAITLLNVANEFKSGKVFFHGVDTAGRPICVIRVRYWSASPPDPLESQRFIVLMMDIGRVLMRSHPPETTATLFFDMTDAWVTNIDYQALQFMITLLKKYYPKSLGRIIIYNYAWYLYGVWKIIEPWLDEQTLAKVYWVTPSDISTYISADNLMTEYCGNDDYKYDAENYASEVTQYLSELGYPEPLQKHTSAQFFES